MDTNDIEHAQEVARTVLIVSEDIDHDPAFEEMNGLAHLELRRDGPLEDIEIESRYLKPLHPDDLACAIARTIFSGNFEIPPE
jgi:hypothetical protein